MLLGKKKNTTIVKLYKVFFVETILAINMFQLLFDFSLFLSRGCLQEYKTSVVW